MMSKVSILILLSVCYLACIGCDDPSPANGYETKYDNIDLDELLKNDRLRKNYVKCLVNEGPCTPDAQELKNSLPDAIATNCSKCTTKQKNGSAKVTYFLIDNQPDEWERLSKLYDKDGEYKRKYLESKLTELGEEISEKEKDENDDEFGDENDNTGKSGEDK